MTEGGDKLDKLPRKVVGWVFSKYCGIELLIKAQLPEAKACPLS